MIGRSDDRQALIVLLALSGVLMKGSRRVGKSTLLDDLDGAPPVGWVMVRVDLEKAHGLSEGVEALRADLHRHGLVPDSWEDIVRVFRAIEVQGVEIDLTALLPRDQIGALLATATAGLPKGHRLGLLLDEVPWWLDSVQTVDGGSAAANVMMHLRALRARFSPSMQMVLTGSVGLRPLATMLECDDSLTDLADFELDPLDLEAGSALFEVELAGHTVREEAKRHAWELAAGVPEWIVELANHMPELTEEVGVAHVEAAADNYLSSGARPFDRERRRHLVLRHGEQAAEVMKQALDVAAGRNGWVPIRGLVAVVMAADSSLSARKAAGLIEELIEAYYLRRVDHENVVFHCPLFARAWMLYGSDV